MQDSVITNPAMAHAAAGSDASAGRMARLMVLLFMLSMLIPVWLNVGSIKLIPHRIILLLMFVPLCIQLLSGRAGKIRAFDVLLLVSTCWAVLAIMMNHNPSGSNLQSIGIYVLEFYGAYLLGRVAIRSAEDFTRFTRIFLIVLMVLVPFAIAEAVTHRAIMLDLIPKSVAKTITPDRWGMRRAQTVFAHPILFGVFCSIGFGLFWYALKSTTARFGGAILSVTGTIFSLSSGALIAITMQAVLIGWERVMKKVKRRWMIFAILAVLAYFAIDLLSNRTPFHVLITYATFSTSTSYNRILIWRYGMENVWANPLFGLGENVQSWARPYWMSSSADNYWLLLTMKYGIPCFLAIAIALFLIIRRVGLAPLASPVSQACRAGYLTALGGLIMAGGTVHFWHGVMAFVMFFFGAGVWMIDAGEKDRQAAERGDSADPADEGPGSGRAPPDREMIYTRQSPRHDRRARAKAPPELPNRRRARRG